MIEGEVSAMDGLPRQCNKDIAKATIRFLIMHSPLLYIL